MSRYEPSAADPQPGARPSAARKAGAFAVHVLTASGAAFALLALIAAVEEQWAMMFWWLGAALIIDGVDGTLARRLDVPAVLPRWSGDSLDFAVDFVTYVFVPAYAMAQSELLPPIAAIPAGVLIAVTGALYFADREMKLSDNCFRGFPALWNLAAFYLFLLRPPPWIGIAAIVVLAGLTFARFPFVHPVRVGRLRALNLTLLAAWSVLAVAALARNFDAGPWISTGLCIIAVYFLAAGVIGRSGEKHGNA